jgi:hypothetical protein
MSHFEDQRVWHGDHMTLRHPSGAVERYGSWLEPPEASAQAIRAMGSNGIAFYMRRLKSPAPPPHYSQTPMRERIQAMAYLFGIRHPLFNDIEAERRQATTALILLRPLPPGSSKELLELSKGTNGIAVAAQCVLQAPENWKPWSTNDSRAAEAEARAKLLNTLAGLGIQPPPGVLDNGPLWGAPQRGRNQTGSASSNWSVSPGSTSAR